MPGSPVQELIQNGWRQGSSIPAGVLSKFLGELPQFWPPPGPDDCFVVVSQTCDLLHHCLEAEPLAEVLLCRRISQADGALLYRKNPRRLHVEVTNHQGAIVLEALACEKFSIPRTCLAGLTPDSELALPSGVVSTIAAWLANRYLRPAYPDAFNERLRPVRKKLDDLQKREGRYFERLLLNLEPPDEELGDGDTYSMVLWCVLHPDFVADESAISAAEQVADSLLTILQPLRGVEAEACEVRLPAEVSLHDLRAFRDWHTEHVTVKQEFEPPT